MKAMVPLLGLFLLSFTAFAQEKTHFEKQLFIMGEDTLRCRILSPQNFNPKKKYPLVIFLHGSGERGLDNESQLNWGADWFADSLARARFPAIVVFPQCPPTDTWGSVKRSLVKDSLGGFSFDTVGATRKPLELVLHFIDSLKARGAVDASRIYLGGLSMGGFGTYEALWRRPDLFAAAFPICGGGSPEKAARYRPGLPVWVFHGDADPVVPVWHSQRMVLAMKASGAKVTYTEYPGVGHDSWKNAFAEKGLMDWIFKQKMPAGKKGKKG